MFCYGLSFAISLYFLQFENLFTDFLPHTLFFIFYYLTFDRPLQWKKMKSKHPFARSFTHHFSFISLWNHSDLFPAEIISTKSPLWSSVKYVKKNHVTPHLYPTSICIYIHNSDCFRSTIVYKLLHLDNFAVLVVCLIILL